MRINKIIHACLVIENRNQQIIVDPAVSLFDDKFDYKIFENANACLLTHAHLDHSKDIQILAHKFPQMKFYVNIETGEYIKSHLTIDPKSIVSFELGAELYMNGLNIKVVPASHSSSLNGQYLGSPCGFVVLYDENTYIVGDSALSADFLFTIDTYQISNIITPYDGQLNLSSKDLVRLNKIRPNLKYMLYHDEFPKVLTKELKIFIKNKLIKNGLTLIDKV